MKLAAFVLGVLTGTLGAYFFLTRVWWPDVRIPGDRSIMKTAVDAVLTAAPPPLGASKTDQAQVTPAAISPSPEASSPPPFAAPALVWPSSDPASASFTATPPSTASAEPPILTTDLDRLRGRGLAIPVFGLAGESLRDSFADDRGGRSHAAIDIMAPRGTPVIAVEGGRVEKLFTSKLGGLTVYQFDPLGEYCYYYAHLDGYAPGLAEDKVLRKGDVIGYVGATGNAPPNAPHLHFSVFRLNAQKHWWEGTSINPFFIWAARP